MADWYFDWDNGSDANAGNSAAAPKKSYDAFNLNSAAAGDTFWFKRGTRQIISTQWKYVKPGAGRDMPTRYRAYGEAQVSNYWFDNPSGIGGMILLAANSSFIHFDDAWFDCSGPGVTKSLYAASQGASNTSYHTYRRCHFFGSQMGTGATITREGTSTANPIGFVYEDCHAYDNGAHGFASNGFGHVYRRCQAYRNGANSPSGGHGFSMIANRTSVNSGWSLVSGTVYSRTVGAAETGVFLVKSPYPYPRLIPDPALGVGTFHIDGTTLSVNIGVNPNGVEVIYAWGKTERLVIEDCEAYDNIHNPAAPYREGHGYAFDDFTSASVMRRCTARDNQGSGFSINMGENNTLESCVARGNHRRAVGAASGRNTRIYNLLAVDNYADGSTAYADVDFALMGTGGVVENSVIIGRAAHGVANNTGVANSITMRNNAIYGHGARTLNNTETGAIMGDPMIDASGVPLAGSQCRGAGIARLGALDRNGFRFSVGAPTVGAYEVRAKRGMLG